MKNKVLLVIAFWVVLATGAVMADVSVTTNSLPPSTNILTQFSMGGDTGGVGMFEWTTTNNRWALAQSFFVSGNNDWSVDKLTVRVREFGTSVVGQEYTVELWSIANPSSIYPDTLVSSQSGTFPTYGLTAGYWTFDISDVMMTHGSYYAFVLGFNSGPDPQRFVDVVKNSGTDLFPDGRMFYRVGTPGSWTYYFVSDKDIDFSIQGSAVPELVVKIPNGGEEWTAGTTQTIQWEPYGDVNIPIIHLEYSANNGIDWNDVNAVPNTGSYQWTVPMITSNQCRVRISDANDANVYDTSDNVFIIYVCQLLSLGDLNKDCKIDFVDFAIMAQDWLRNGNPFDEGYTEPLPIMWVYINDPGVSGHEGFTGYMSKYETTNAQYCQFLNAALASGDITISGNNIIGASGSNNGADFVGQVYYNLAGAGLTNDGATNGGATRIHYSSGVFSVDSEFENHPVTYVSWYGATAFCNYYGYRLPTEWEWQAVADYDGSYSYGCGTSINNSIANYSGSAHPNGTTVVGAFGTYGYGICDMAGNVLEWTSSYSGPNLQILGGSWYNSAFTCTVTYRNNYSPSSWAGTFGFRACR